mmetsp:Transcript_19087/g.29428  ORF Transcript_19087/g.29428 Transcript_19087/m.29428 type:complete len:282 (+) Transcript_19087:47-892(+)
MEESSTENPTITMATSTAAMEDQAATPAMTEQSTSNSTTAPATKSTSKSTSTSTTSSDFEPPAACIRRLLKQTLPKSTNISKDSLSALSRASGIFILYLTACANDVAREGRRTTIVAKDVIGALKELDFEEFVPSMERFLEGHRREERSKKEEKERMKNSGGSNNGSNTGKVVMEVDNRDKGGKFVSGGKDEEEHNDDDEVAVEDDEKAEHEHGKKLDGKTEATVENNSSVDAQVSAADTDTASTVAADKKHSREEEDDDGARNDEGGELPTKKQKLEREG